MPKVIRLVAVEDLGTTMEVKGGKVESKAATAGGVTAVSLNAATKTLVITSGGREVSVDLTPVVGSGGSVTLDPKKGNLLVSGANGLAVDPATVATLITSTVKGMGLQLVDSNGNRVTLNNSPLSVAPPEPAAEPAATAGAATPASPAANTPAAATGEQATPAANGAQATPAQPAGTPAAAPAA